MIIKNEPGLIVRDTYKDSEVIFENCPGLKFQGAKFINCEAFVCDCATWSMQDVKFDGGYFASYPGKYGPAMNNSPAWIGDNEKIPGQVNALDWMRSWKEGKEQSFDVPAEHIKDGNADYFKNKWTIIDRYGVRHAAYLREFTNNGKGVVRVKLTTKTVVPEGLGLWETYNPLKMTKSVRIDGLEADGMKSFDIYFARNVVVEDSVFRGAVRDYNIGFENCHDIRINRVQSFGNFTQQGNASDVAVRFGCHSLTTTNCEIKTLSVTSNGWSVGDIPEDAFFEDRGDYPVIEVVK